MPSREELSAVWGRITEWAMAKLRGEPVDEAQQARDSDTVERWAEAEGADLENEAARARANLGSAGRTHP